MKPREFFRRLWNKPIFRHLLSGAVAVFISTTAVKHGVDAQTAQQAGAAVKEVIQQLPNE